MMLNLENILDMILHSYEGLELSPSVGLLHEQGELHQAVTVEHRTSASYMSKSYGKALYLFLNIYRISRSLDQQTISNQRT